MADTLITLTILAVLLGVILWQDHALTQERQAARTAAARADAETRRATLAQWAAAQERAQHERERTQLAALILLATPGALYRQGYHQAMIDLSEAAQLDARERAA